LQTSGRPESLAGAADAELRDSGWTAVEEELFVALHAAKHNNEVPSKNVLEIRYAF
jgi:hypothetical protein